MKIVKYKPEYYDQVESIFFDNSTKKEFSSEEERRNFLNKYLVHYLENCSESCFVALNEKVIGYILICVDTAKDDDLLRLNPTLKNYQNHFSDYPAHLHINTHSSQQGKGVGGKLLNDAIAKINVKGIHLITAQNARNVHFYLKNNFQIVENYPDNTVILGRKLSDAQRI